MPNPEALPREIAEVVPPRELAEDRTFSETEHTAILAAAIQRETAEVATQKQVVEAEREALKSEKAALETQLSVEQVAKAAVEAELAELKASIERDAEVAARTDERAAKVREASAHMPDEWFTDEKKAVWAGMEQAHFDTLVTTLSEVKPATTAASTAGREVASVVAGAPVSTGKTDTKPFFSQV